MKDVTLVYPHQLFRSQPALAREREVFLLEDPYFFTRFPFHQQKLVLHRASLHFYHDHLLKQGFQVTYIPLNKAGDMASLLKGCASVHVADPIEHDLGDRLAQAARKAGARVVLYDTPAFVIDGKTIDEEMGGRSRYLMEGFYEKWRKRLGILTKGGEPVGGRWSYDPENRQRLPEGARLPTPWRPAVNAHVREAVGYVQTHFGRNYGRAEEFRYAVTFADAGHWLDDFVEHRLRAFGPYEDAMRRGEVVLYHSQLSHLLNIGLLTPQQVLDAAIDEAQARKVPINSLEGFVRQILGWREFMRAVYRLRGKEQKQANLFGHRRKLPDQFWRAQTGLEPLDDTIGRVLQHAYCHHIERLMVLGAIMLLCEIAPDEVYRWFMTLFIDAYDWVMVPNVYGMSQYADGGLLSTKPYVTSSQYILRMSDYRKGSWCDVWDGLYWRFLYRNREELSKRARMGLALSPLKRMRAETLKGHLQTAEAYLQGL